MALTLLFAVGLPVIAILVAVVAYLYYKNKRLETELTVELNEMSPRTNQERKGRPFIAQPNLGAFNRGGGNNFNRLMDSTEDETGGYRPPSGIQNL